MQPRTLHGRLDRLEDIAKESSFVRSRLNHLRQCFKNASNPEEALFQGNKTALKVALIDALQDQGKAPVSANHMARALSQAAVANTLRNG